jgi:CBS domain-containing protein
MQVAEFMTTNPHGVQASESVRHAGELMAKHNIGAVLVYEDTQLVGIVTDRDLVVRSLASGTDPDTETVRAVMTPHPVSVPRTTSADDALKLMVERSIGRLCVMDGGTVEGIITFGDLSPLAQLVADGLARKQPARVGA